eukprot:gene6637-8210_t
MGDSFADYEADFQSIVEEIDRGIKALNPSAKNRKEFEIKTKVDLLRNRLNRAKQILRSYKIDIREIEKAHQPKYTAKATQFEERIKALENELNWAEKQNENGGLGAAGAEQTPHDDYQSTMQQAKNIQKEDLTRVNHILQEVTTISQEGQATLEEMAIQEEQMKKIDKDFNEIDANLKLATRQMRVFARKMATDKIIMGLVLLIVLAIIFVIVWSIVKPKSNPKVRDQIIRDNN